MDGHGVEDVDEDLAIRVTQLCNAMTGRPLTNDELTDIASYPRQLALLFPGLLPEAAAEVTSLSA
jgi:homocitrate synthase NifV